MPCVPLCFLWPDCNRLDRESPIANPAIAGRAPHDTAHDDTLSHLRRGAGRGRVAAWEHAC